LECMDKRSLCIINLKILNNGKQTKKAGKNNLQR